MSLLKKDLPLLLILRKSTGEEIKIQGSLKGLDQKMVHFVLPSKQPALYEGAKVEVLFFIKKFEFWFESEIIKINSEVELFLLKPQAIHKRKQRNAPRLNVSTPIRFSVWEKTGLNQGMVYDLSSTGCRFKTKYVLILNQILNIDIYISEPRHKIRIICEALVTRVGKKGLGQNDLFEVGILFTTLSHSSIEKIEAFIAEKISGTDKRKDRNTTIAGNL